MTRRARGARPGRVAARPASPHGILGGVALLAALAVVACDRQPAILQQARRVELVRALDAELLASVAAEKSAVMAMTDEESAAFADESRRRMAVLTPLHDELHRLVVSGGLAAEKEKLAAFEREWAALRDVDARLLDLAVANSNLKAARLAAGEATVALDRLLAALTAAEGRTDDPALLRRLSAASTAALRVQTLLPVHIASPDDAEMTRLETRIRELSAPVQAALRDVPGPEASAAWADYERLTGEVIRLSRLNTNVRSVDVSLHEKRRVTDACRSALAALLAEIEAGSRATR